MQTRDQCLYGPTFLGNVVSVRYGLLNSQGVIFASQSRILLTTFAVCATTRNRGRGRGRELTVTGRESVLQAGIAAACYVMMLNGDATNVDGAVLRAQLQHARANPIWDIDVFPMYIPPVGDISWCTGTVDELVERMGGRGGQLLSVGLSCLAAG